MLAIIVILFLVLVAAAFTIYVSQRAAFGTDPNHDLPPARLGGLFDEHGGGALGAIGKVVSSQRVELLERAHQGELQPLSEAHTSRDAKLYCEVLDALVEWAAERQEKLIALVSHISKSNELRANGQLAERLIAAWKTAPDRRLTTEMIHIAALSDDAAIYQRAVEEALDFWRRGKLAEFRPEELNELFVSQFWVIAPEARRGGAGFALKRRLADVRRQLAAATPAP